MTKLMNARHCLLVLYLLNASPSVASDPSPPPRGMEAPAINIKGNKFTAGERVEKVFPGVSFIVPPGWNAVQPEGEDIVLLGSNKVTALGYVFVSSTPEEQDWEKRLNEPIPFMHRLLNPSARATHDKNIWKNTFVDTEDPNYVGWGVVLVSKSETNVIYLLECDSFVKMHCEQTMEYLIHTTRTN